VDWLRLLRLSVKGVRGAIGRSLSRIVRIIFMKLHQQHVVRGVKVVLSDMTQRPEQALDSIRSALDILQETDPRRFLVVRRHVRHILVWPGSYTAYDAWGGIHLAARHLSEAPAEVLASAFVHEATHLRIAKLGIPYDPELRGRIEALCVDEQAAFLRKVSPQGSEWAEQVQAGLKDPWWTESHRRARVQRSLNDAGLPQWIEPLLYRRRR